MFSASNGYLSMGVRTKRLGEANMPLEFYFSGMFPLVQPGGPPIGGRGNCSLALGNWKVGKN